MKAKALYLLIFFLLYQLNVKAYELTFTRISTNNGLSSNFVNCISQSADGYIWVGTQNGLQRYDGYRFTQAYRNTIKNRLPTLPVNQIIPIDKKPYLWLRMGQTLGLFNTDKYSFIEIKIKNRPIIPDNNLLKLIKDKEGNILLITGDFNIYVYNETTKLFEQNDRHIKTDKGWQAVDLVDDGVGNFWIAGVKGLGYYSKRDKKFYTPTYNPKQLAALQLTKEIKYIRDFKIDSKQRFFINSWPPGQNFRTYLVNLQEKTKTIIPNEPDQSSNYHDLIDITETTGIIWGFGDHYFNIYNEKDKRFFAFYNAKNISYKIKFSRIFQVFEDKDKNIWVATDNGIYMASVLRNYVYNSTINYFGTASISAIKAIGNNKILMGSWGGKAKILNYNTKFDINEEKELTAKLYKGVPPDVNYSMIWDAVTVPNLNEVWLSCQSGRLIRYNILKNKSEFLNPKEFQESTIRSINVDRNDNLWFGTSSGLLIKRNKNNEYKAIGNLKNGVVKIYLDKNNYLWATTIGNGVFLIDPATNKIVRNYTSHPNQKGLSTNRVEDITQLNDSIMAIACSSNLDLLNTKTQKIERITGYEGLPQQIITSMQVDNNGYLWMSTIGGICRYDHKTKLFRMFDQKDGLLGTSDLTNLMDESYKLPDGNLAFAGVNNFIIFNPTYLNRYIKPKNVILTDFKLFDNYLSIDSIQKAGGIKLKYNQNSISISFASLSYQQSNKLKYFYKLTGANENWIKAENGLSASFASLAPGSYTFMVRAQNSDGVFSDRITKLNIEIVPPFWFTWWFLIIIIALGILLGNFIYRLRLRRIIEVQRIREKVARDLHDDVGSTLTSINILSEMADSKLAREPEVVKDYLKRISKNSSQMMDSMDDIVWSINPTNDQLPRIAARMREYTANILEPQNIRYVFKSNDIDNSVKLDMDARRNLFLIFKEALNNITKYAKADKVEIGLNYTKGHVVLTIKDNGIGFDLNDEKSGNGLVNMRKRAGLLKADIEITTALNKGTQIVVKLIA